MTVTPIASTRVFSARVFLSLAAVGLIAVIAAPVRADMDLTKERATTAQHAGLAAKAQDMKATQMHLHHVVNCLVGPNGQGFDAKEANPCKDQGNGLIPDTTDAAQRTKLNQALTKANAGLKQTGMAAAQKDASDAQALISGK